MSSWGGTRTGTGRKSKSVKYLTEIGEAERRIADRLPELIDNLFALADGGDRAANEYLINRVMGKPTERTEITGEDGGPVEITAEIEQKAAFKLNQFRQRMMSELSTSQVLGIAATSSITMDG